MLHEQRKKYSGKPYNSLRSIRKQILPDKFDRSISKIGRRGQKGITRNLVQRRPNKSPGELKVLHITGMI
jgi:hypothetical protein